MAEMTSQTGGTVPRIGTLVNWAGALTSLALIVGLGFWGTQMVIRDVSGVPVVRAQEGNMRVEPETPGGRPASHQGLAVNSVAADGEAAGPADQLVLAPAPVDVDDLPANQQRFRFATHLDPIGDQGSAFEKIGSLDIRASTDPMLHFNIANGLVKKHIHHQTKFIVFAGF